MSIIRRLYYIFVRIPRSNQKASQIREFLMNFLRQSCSLILYCYIIKTDCNVDSLSHVNGDCKYIYCSTVKKNVIREIISNVYGYNVQSH